MSASCEALRAFGVLSSARDTLSVKGSSDA